MHNLFVYTFIVCGIQSVFCGSEKIKKFLYSLLTDIAEKFSVAMALLNLALRPISVVMLGRICADRMGSDDGFPRSFGNLFGGMYFVF